MKVIVYHANSPNNHGDEIYKKLFFLLKKNVNQFGFPLVHLTTTNHEAYGDETYFYDLDPEEIVYNRELCFIEYLKHTADKNEVYWFTEPDSRINNQFPSLNNDIDLLYRNDAIPITPAWRLAKKSALPIFETILSYFDTNHKKWNGDGYGIVKFYKEIGSPTNYEPIIYKNCKIGFRDYKSYCMRKSIFTQQFKADHKEELIAKFS